jgi:hypothetical protein
MQKLKIIFSQAGVLLMALLVYIVLKISKDGPYTWEPPCPGAASAYPPS